MKKKGIGITLGIMCFVLVFALSIQIKTVEKSDSVTLKTYREDELRTEVLKWKDKYDTVYEKFQENEKVLEEYRNNAAQSGETNNAMKKELTEANAIIGLSDVKGSGIILTLNDSASEVYITDSQLLEVVNELKAAGAEAISINGQRIIPTSEIRFISTVEMVINGETIVSPYVIKAIGNKDNLESSLKIKSGVIDNFRKNNVIAEIEIKDDITIQKYDGVINFKYAKSVE